jgi:hypothetical protein
MSPSTALWIASALLLATGIGLFVWISSRWAGLLDIVTPVFAIAMLMLCIGAAVAAAIGALIT